MRCMPSTADCGGLMIGVDSSEPNTPPLEMVKVPPVMSSTVSVPSLAVLPIVGDRLLDLGEAHAVGGADHGNDEAPRRRNRDRNVEKVVIDDLVAFDAGVDRGTSSAASATAFTKKPMKPRRMPCFFSNKSL